MSFPAWHPGTEQLQWKEMEQYGCINQSFPAKKNQYYILIFKIEIDSCNMGGQEIPTNYHCIGFGTRRTVAIICSNA